MTQHKIKPKQYFNNKTNVYIAEIFEKVAFLSDFSWFSTEYSDQSQENARYINISNRKKKKKKKKKKKQLICLPLLEFSFLDDVLYLVHFFSSHSITRIQQGYGDQQNSRVVSVFSFNWVALILQQVSKIRGGIRYMASL